MDHTPYFPDNISEYAPWVAKHGLTAPYGECQCGCHQLAPIADHTIPRYDSLKGHPRRFIHNHHGVGTRRKFPNPRTVLERLQAKTVIVGECWLWQGATNGHYGRISIDRKQVFVHRTSWEYHFGPIPDNTNVNHNCPGGDNALCWNPAHLWLGSQLDNIADTVAKGRVRHGTANHHAKITEDDVREIRNLRAQGMTLDAIAERFNITFSNAGLIARRDTWKHVIP